MILENLLAQPTGGVTSPFAGNQPLAQQ
jgi:hypothetical protein